MISQRAFWQLLHRDSEVRSGSFFPFAHASPFEEQQTNAFILHVRAGYGGHCLNTCRSTQLLELARIVFGFAFTAIWRFIGCTLWNCAPDDLVRL